MPIKTTHLLIAYAVAAGAAAIVVPAMAQDPAQVRIESSATASPNKAGTAAHPRGLSLRAAARLVFPPDVEAPIVTGIEIRSSPGLDWHGGKYVKCAKATLSRKGPSGCPRESIMGTATATGRADTVAARLDVVFVNGGEGTTYAYATLNRPARIRETLVIHTKRFSSGPWGHEESVQIPPSLQIVAGVPLQLDRITLAIGGKSYAKGYISSTACPSGGWRYEVTAHTATGDQTGETVGTGRISCTR
jgi:hypothetical protein